MLRRLVPWLALLGLVAVTILLWQARFAAIAHPLNGDAGFGQNFDGWNTSGGKNGWHSDEGVPVARFARPAHDGEFNSATRWLGPPVDLHYLKVEVEAKWSDVTGGGVQWSTPRLTLLTKNRRKHTRSNWQDSAFLTHGSRGWHREQTVFELTPKLGDLGLAFQMLGRQGRMEVRRFRITALKRRPWVPAATALLVAGWVLWLAGRLRGRHHPLAWWRTLPAAGMVIAASWFLVFPGTPVRSRPLVGGFLTGMAEQSPPAAAKAAAKTTPPQPATAKPPPASPPQPRQRVIPGTAQAAVPQLTPAQATVKQQAATAKPPPKTPPKPPGRPLGIETIRDLNLKLDLVHILAFFLLSLAVFTTIGSVTPWRLIAVVGILSEAVPRWHNGWGDTEDLLDLSSNLIGVALAASAFVLLARLVKKLKR